MGLVLRLAASTLALFVFLPSAAAGQTRTEQLEEQRVERARQVQSRTPTKLDEAIAFVQKKQLVQRAMPVAGFYPKFGGVTLGGGFAVGAGYRRPFVNDNLRFEAAASFTRKGYWLGNAELSLPRLFKHTLEIKGHIRSSHFPQEEFFGLGPDSRKSDRTNFRIDETEYAASAAWHARPWLTLASQQAWRKPSIGAGTDWHHPSTATLFTDETAPGLAEQTTYIETGGLAEIDYLDEDGSPRSGGRYVVYASRFDDRRNRGFDFSRVASQIEQYIPIFDRKRVIVGRLATNRLTAAPGSRVPFYYMTPFGGKHSIRGFDDLRFRDMNAWVLNAEYRWEAIAGVDLALFYDRGGFGARFKDLSPRKAHESYGVGLRAGTAQNVFVRAEVAFGSREGLNVYLTFSGPLALERFLR